ncbi:MAG: ATP synthase F1 subunit epsilon [Leptospiraceae bacterium]|nr:ATP synthase F1 subunit epsilon [Leptospiraceae bacterium]
MADTKFEISVISPEKVLYTGEANHTVIPGSDGSFGVMANHAPLIAELGIGVLKIENGTETLQMVVDGGFAQIKNNVVNVLANGGDLEKDLKLDVVNKALEEANNSDSKDKDKEIQKAKVRLTLLKK